MPNDYITINALAEELNSLLKEGKIDKIYMPEKDEVTIAIRANSKNYNLAISCNASNPRIHLTNIKKINPVNAPSFCMHLRKYLTNGIIKKIYTLNEDRIIVIDIVSHNEMRDEVIYKLIIEIMGRYSNMVVVNEKNIITDALKQVSFDMMTKRALIPSAQYSAPEQTKLLLSQTEEIFNFLEKYSGGGLSNYLCSGISGLAKDTAQDIVAFSKIIDETTSIDKNNIKDIIKSLSIYKNIFNTKYYKPCVSFKNSIAQDYYVKKYIKINEIKEFKTLNEAIENCLAKKDEEYRRQEKTKYLLKSYSSFLSKCNKKLEKSEQRLAEASSKNIYRKYGELIISNLYRINKGDKNCVVEDYYEINQPQITIKLDETLTPQQNAQMYFKKYNKLKHAEEIAISQIKELKETIEYLKTIEIYINRCATPQEILEIQQELEDIGAFKATSKKQKKKEKDSYPISYLINDFVVLIGKNNFQNDKLTFKIANGKDMWLHTKTYHSSHVIILSEGREIPINIIEIAAQICAFYSECKDKLKVEVDYTYRKNVKRHPNKKPGMVLYEDYSTIIVKPNENRNYLK